MRAAAALLLAAFALVPPARADDEGPMLAGTLQAIRERGTIRIGHREDVVPFAFANRAGQPVGYSIDICRGIAADIAAALNAELLEPDAPSWQRGIRIAYVPVAAEARLPMVSGGAVDLECGSTTTTAERARVVGFSPVIFLAGTKLLVKAGAPAAGYRALAGQSVAVTAGTTNEAVLRRLATTVSPPLQLLVAPSLEAALATLAAGRAAAMASDDILLAGLVALKGVQRDWRIVGDYLSYEPYAIAFRRDDPGLAELVNASFRRMAAAGELRRLYDRWFLGRLPNGERLALPMSLQLAELFRALGQPD